MQPPNKLSVFKDSPKYSHESFNPNIRVFLDDVEQRYVLEYDVEECYVLKHPVNAHGKLIVEGNTLLIEKSIGKVSVEYRT